jgi:hypothetical protein
VGLERGPLSLVSTNVEEKVADPIYKTKNSAVGIRRTDHLTPSIRKVGLTSPTGGGRPIGIVRSRTKVTESLAIHYSLFTIQQDAYVM